MTTTRPMQSARSMVVEGLMALEDDRQIVAALFAFDYEGDSVRGFATVAEARSALRWLCGADQRLVLVEFDEPQPAWEDWETSWSDPSYGWAPVQALWNAPRTILADVTIAPSEGRDEDPWTRLHHVGADLLRCWAWHEAESDGYLMRYRIKDWLRANP